jgi:hypothetical protein
VRCLLDGDTAIVFGTAKFRFAVEGKDDDASSARYTQVHAGSIGQGPRAAGSGFPPGRPRD